MSYGGNVPFMTLGIANWVDDDTYLQNTPPTCSEQLDILGGPCPQTQAADSEGPTN